MSAFLAERRHSEVQELGAWLIRTSRVVNHRAWRGIAASHKRVALRPAITGGSNDGHVSPVSIRARLANGSLPRLAGAAWAGRALGNHRCACCDQVIGPSEVEYETRERVDGSDGIADGALFLHIGCFTAWLSESRALDAPPPRSKSTADGASRPDS